MGDDDSVNGTESPASVAVIKSTGVVDESDQETGNYWSEHPTVTSSLSGLSSLAVAVTK